MKISRCTIATAIVALGLTALLLRADAGQALKVDFASDTVGAEPKAFLSVVGIWRIESEGSKKVLAVDGTQWKEGQTAAGVADKARALYGDRYAEFLDRVQAYAYFPYTVAKDVEDFRDGGGAPRVRSSDRISASRCNSSSKSARMDPRHIGLGLLDVCLGPSGAGQTATPCPAKGRCRCRRG